MRVGLVEDLGRRRAAVVLPGRGARPEDARRAAPAGAGPGRWRRGRAGRAPSAPPGTGGPSSRSLQAKLPSAGGRTARTASCAPQRGWTSWRPATWTDRAGRAVLLEHRDAVPDHRRELPGAVAQDEAQELRAVATAAHLGGAHQQGLVDLLAVGEVADEHGPNRRSRSGWTGGLRRGRGVTLRHPGTGRAAYRSSDMSEHPDGTQDAPDPDRWWTLAAVCAAVFMLLLDITIVNVALPDIAKSLGSSFSDLQWVIDAYALSLAALLLTAGSLADRLGRRAVFVAGLAVFTLASLLCGLSHEPDAPRPRPRPAGHRRRGDVRDVARAARGRPSRAASAARPSGSGARRRAPPWPSARSSAACSPRASGGSRSSSSTSRSASPPSW